jgi:hypothetical protein
MSPRSRSPIHHQVDLERRRQLGVEFVADAMIVLLVRERLRELDALDAETAAAADDRTRALVRKAVLRCDESGARRLGSRGYVSSSGTSWSVG